MDFKSYIAIIYRKNPDRYQMWLTADPENMILRKSKVVNERVKLGYSYGFSEIDDAFYIMKRAEAALDKIHGKDKKRWFDGQVARACWSIDIEIKKENQIRMVSHSQKPLLRSKGINAIFEAAISS